MTATVPATLPVGQPDELPLPDPNDPLLEQQDKFKLASGGAGTRFKFVSHLNGSLDVGLPLDNGAQTNAYEPLLTFRLWADF